MEIVFFLVLLGEMAFFHEGGKVYVQVCCLISHFERVVLSRRVFILYFGNLAAFLNKVVPQPFSFILFLPLLMQNLKIKKMLQLQFLPLVPPRQLPLLFIRYQNILQLNHIPHIHVSGQLHISCSRIQCSFRRVRTWLVMQQMMRLILLLVINVVTDRRWTYS